jgi:hypothetical protein
MPDVVVAGLPAVSATSATTPLTGAVSVVPSTPARACSTDACA